MRRGWHSWLESLWRRKGGTFCFLQLPFMILYSQALLLAPHWDHKRKSSHVSLRAVLIWERKTRLDHQDGSQIEMGILGKLCSPSIWSLYGYLLTMLQQLQLPTACSAQTGVQPWTTCHPELVPQIIWHPRKYQWSSHGYREIRETWETTYNSIKWEWDPLYLLHLSKTRIHCRDALKDVSEIKCKATTLVILRIDFGLLKDLVRIL